MTTVIQIERVFKQHPKLGSLLGLDRNLIPKRRLAAKNFSKDVLRTKGGDTFKTINREDINKIFQAYDRIFSRATLIPITDIVLTDTSEYGYQIKRIGGNRYKIIVSPIELIKRKSNNETRLDVICNTLEMSIASILCDYLQIGVSVDQLYDYLFIQDVSNNTNKLGAFANSRFSCYLDSLMMIICTAASNVIRDPITTENLTTIKWPNPHAIGDSSSNVKTQTDVRTIATMIQTEIKNNLTKINQGQIFSCDKLLQLLAVFYPEMKNSMYNATHVYDLLCTLFPKLKAKVPVKIKLNNKITLEERSFNLFQFWDYMEGEPDCESYSHVLWDKLEEGVGPDLLVFQNGGFPPIIRYNQTGKERLQSGEIIVKKRVFNEYILGNKYRIFGLLGLSGVGVNGTDSGHYTAFIRSRDYKSNPEFNKRNLPTPFTSWYYYNDIGPQHKCITHLPERVWVRSPTWFPELLFYVKV